MTNCALMAGSVIEPRKVISGETLGCMPENRERLLALARNYRLRRHEDGWFVDGRGHKSQIWEYGVAKLGLTVIGPKFVAKVYRIGDWLNRKSIGDDEANFWCDWTDENLLRLQALTGLQRRKKPPSRA